MAKSSFLSKGICSSCNAEVDIKLNQNNRGFYNCTNCKTLATLTKDQTSQIYEKINDQKKAKPEQNRSDNGDRRDGKSLYEYITGS